jgi:hypothetical protein
MKTAYERGVEDAERLGSWIFDCPFCASKNPQEYADWVKGFRYTRAKQEKLANESGIDDRKLGNGKRC